MTILRIEHPVPNYDAWKQAFDADPLDRAASGVRRYSVLRPAGDANYVLVDLEFEELPQAEAMLAKLQRLWDSVQGTIMSDPRARVLEIVESREL